MPLVATERKRSMLGQAYDDVCPKSVPVPRRKPAARKKAKSKQERNTYALYINSTYSNFVI